MKSRRTVERVLRYVLSITLRSPKQVGGNTEDDMNQKSLVMTGLNSCPLGRCAQAW